MTDKMREAFESDFDENMLTKLSDGSYYDSEIEESWCSFRYGWECALTQQPESELTGTVGNCYGPDNRGLYRIAVFSGSPFPVGTTVYTSRQPSAQVRVPTEIEAEKIADDCRCGDGTYNLVEVVEKLAKFMAPSIAEKRESSACKLYETANKLITKVGADGSICSKEKEFEQLYNAVLEFEDLGAEPQP